VSQAWALLAYGILLCLSSDTMSSWLPSFGWGKAEEREFEDMAEEIKYFYTEKLLPLEEKYRFHAFHTSAMNDADFDAKPLVMMVGQYSTGKTTFIRYLLGKDFPGLDIGKSPTTRKFTLVMSGEDNTEVSGSVLMNDPTTQFRTLTKYGTAFENMFQLSTTTSPVLKYVSFLDTPGILSGEKTRDYDNIAVLEWFAERADRVLLFFDADKLDISDEFRKAIEAFSGLEDKLRFVLNKADMNHVDLLRVYGSLMWNLGRVLKSPEVVKVYIGSFRDNPIEYKVFEPLIESEVQLLLSDLQSVPKSSANRKLGDLIKRTKKAKAHALVLSKLKDSLLSAAGTIGWWYEASRKEKMKEIIRNLQEEIYDPLIDEYNMSQEDFPDIKKMKKLLVKEDFDTFEDLDKDMLKAIDDWMDHGLASKKANEIGKEEAEELLSGGAFEGVMGGKSSFLAYPNIINNKDQLEASALFQTLGLKDDAKLDVHQARNEMVKSSLPQHVLQRIWKLSDVDHDTMLTLEEYRVTRFLIRLVLAGNDLPMELPSHFFPHSEGSKDKMKEAPVQEPPSDGLFSWWSSEDHTQQAKKESIRGKTRKEL